jgi:hypothetical protein
MTWVFIQEQQSHDHEGDGDELRPVLGCLSRLWGGRVGLGTPDSQFTASGVRTD